MGTDSRVAWYRFRATFGRLVGAYVSLVLLIGLTGGIALGSIAGARRTQSSYPKFLASTDPSDLTVSAFTGSGQTATSLTKTIARLPGIKRVASVDLPVFVPVNAHGVPDPGAMPNVFTLGSTEGELFTQDRVSVVHGRMADPARADEAVLTPSAARTMHVHVGDSMPLGLFTSHTAPPKLRVTVRFVGIVDFNNQVIEDDIDRAYGFVVLTPALIERAGAIAPAALSPTLYGLQLAHGASDVGAIEHKLIGVIPKGEQYEFHATAPVVAQDEDAIRPESIALGAFGAIATLVALVIAAQAVARQLRAGNQDRFVLRALGAGPVTTMADGLLGVIGAVIIGSLLAVVVAVALSPLMPLGPVRAVYPSPGLAFDWTVLGFGLVGLVVVIAGVALVTGYRQAPHRLAPRRDRARVRHSRAARAAANAGLPAPAVTGIRFAFEPGVGRATVPVRSALFGTVLAIVMVVATLTFASGLRTLISHPRLYGWNWNYMINPSNEVPPQTQAMLTHDPDVAGWTGANNIVIEIDGQSVPVLLERSGATVTAPVLSGHAVDAANQVVLGAATLAHLHKHVGDTVTVTYGTPADAPAYVPPLKLRIVGTATLPAVGFASFVADQTSMGTGAIVSTGIQPEAFRKAQINPDPNLNGVDMAFVRLRPGVSAAQGRANLQRIVNTTDKSLNADPQTKGDTISIVEVQRPAEIVNYRSVGNAPVLLAVGLALGAVVALALTLSASVRSRRRDLALLKALGFTRRQLAAVVAWQSSVAVSIGVVFGVPIGIIIGRATWDLFARAINAVPLPTVPAGTIALVAVAALVLANVVAALPGLQAARTPSALLLQAE